MCSRLPVFIPGDPAHQSQASFDQVSYALHLFDAPEKLTTDQISPLMEVHGKQLRAAFIAKHGYQPEDSTTPYVPVTINGPQDHDAYYAKEYP